MTKIILFISTLVFISSCSTLSEKECKSGDWKSIGYNDGKNGYANDRLASHNKACSEYGITINSKLYNQGRAAGLKIYCVPENGYRLGESGRSYHNVCESKSFNENYRLGKKVNSLNNESKKLDKEINGLEEQIRNISSASDEKLRLEGEIRANQNRINSLNTTLASIRGQAQRMSILEQINQAHQNNSDAQRKITNINIQLNRASEVRSQIRSLKSRKSKIDKKIMMLKMYAGRNPVEFINLL